MKMVLISIFPKDTIARYLLSSYVLKAYFQKYYKDGQIDIEVMNFHENTDSKQISEKIIDKKPQVVGYSCYTWNIEKVVDVVNKIAEKTSLINILGGPEISQNRVPTLKIPRDNAYFVIGEGERILAKLISYVLQGNKGSIPKGVAYWKDNQCVYLKNDDVITDLDEIPSIYLSGTIDESLYKKQQAFLETQRGCKFRCKYCV
jgi:radical SAM superfamily enzyme YgiQ (UPF0313 family)